MSIRTQLGKIILTAMLVLPTLANAGVIYQFDFYELSNDASDFSITLNFDDYVTTSGLASLAAPKDTSLGYSVLYAGTNNLSWWLFGSTSAPIINDFFASFSPESFLFLPLEPQSDYFISDGEYLGRVAGNVLGIGFSALARLTLTSDTASVPLPGTLLLFVIGLAGVGFSRRSRVLVKV